jgi:hypothetical protein
LANVTIINDMDLVILKYKDKGLKINKVDISDEICYFKVNITLNPFKKSNNSTSKKRVRDNLNLTASNETVLNNILQSNNSELVKANKVDTSSNNRTNSINTGQINITGSNATVLIEPKQISINITMNQNINNSETSPNYTEREKDISNNKTSLTLNFNHTHQNKTLNMSFNNINPGIDYTTIIYKISDPEERDVETISSLILQQTDPRVKENICKKCIDNSDFISDLNKEVSNIKKDLKEFTNGTNSKQELIIRFSDYINRVNLIKIDLYQLTNVVEILRKVECPNYELNNKKYQETLKNANQLIEVIQDSIRKQNLNVNFIVIT